MSRKGQRLCWLEVEVMAAVSMCLAQVVCVLSGPKRAADSQTFLVNPEAMSMYRRDMKTHRRKYRLGKTQNSLKFECAAQCIPIAIWQKMGDLINRITILFIIGYH